MKKPNVIIIMADQLRYDALRRGVTPNLDQLSMEGVEFKNAYCACPLCVPERGAFFTGTYPNTNGSLINPWALLDQKYGMVKEEIDNLYSLMEEDWDSFHAGKQHLYTENGKLEHRENSRTKWMATDETYLQYLKHNQKRTPGGKEFRTLVPEMIQGKFTRAMSYSTPKTGCYEEGLEYFFDGYYTERALESIRQRNPQKPLLLNAMYLAPHPPFDIPEPWYSKIQEVTLPDNVGRWYEEQSPLQLYNLTGVIGSRYTREEWEEIWKVYLGLVNLLDDCVGNIIEELKVQGIYDDSLIIFTSDHGEMLGSHQLFQKMCMYEESVKTPLIMKFPKCFDCSQKKYTNLISGIDIFPTLCDYLELKPKHISDGQSLLPLILGERANLEREEIYIQFDGNGARSNFQRCVIKNGYKLIADIFKDELFLELYYVEEDRMEQENLIFNESYEKRAEEMLGLLTNHMRETSDMLDMGEICVKEFRENYLKLWNRL